MRVTSWSLRLLPLLLVGIVPVVSGQQNPCLPADTLSVSRLQHLVPLLTSTDSLNRSLRDSLGLSQAAVSNVKLVTNKQNCLKALRVLDSLAVADGYPPNPARKFYLYKLGSSWGVEDPATPHLTVGDEYGSRMFVFLSSTWTYRSGTLYPPFRSP